MSAPVVQCEGVTKSYGIVAAVDRVSFALEQGEILSILGPSGCGKTTLLRLIAGFETLDEGEMRIGGRPVSWASGHVPSEHRHVGMVFQEYALFPHMTVAQNVSFGLRAMPKEDRGRRLAEVIRVVRLDGLEQRYPHELSGGEQQRVALARTLAPRPVVMLLDEPFSNLDATMRSEMRGEVEAILRSNEVTAVFVTHDREEAFAMADRIAVMRDGRFDQIGSPDDIYRSPATPFVARIAGMCDFLSGEVRDGRVVTELARVAWTNEGAPYPEGTLVNLLVQADDFQVFPDASGNSVLVSREFRGDETILLVKTPSGATLRCRQRPYSLLASGTRVTLVPSRAEPFVAFARSAGPP